MFNLTKFIFYFLLVLHNTHLWSVTVNAQVNDFEFLLEARSNLKWNKRLYNALIRNVIGVSPLECIQECLRTTRCKSINYRTNLQVCELNYKSEKNSHLSTTATVEQEETVIIEEANFIFGDMKYWKKDIFVSFCNNTSCSINERCRENGTMGWCEISDCGVDLPYVNSTSVIDGNGIGIYYHRTYSCDGSKDNSSIIVCQPDGNWSRSELHCNKDLKKCDTLKEYTYDEDHNVCFKIHYGYKNWTDARKTCLYEDADLFIANTNQRYDFLVALNLSYTLWVGASDIEKEGEWRWVDGTGFEENTLSWDKLLLDNRGNAIGNGSWFEADCLRYNYRKKMFYDNNCDVTRGFICGTITTHP